MEYRTEKIGIFTLAQATAEMTHEELDILLTPSAGHAIETNLGRNPLEVALDRHVEHAAAIATQVKYLARAERKLPSYFTARCIIPSLAFEQSSGQRCAERKKIGGETLLDLTCGLGADTFFLSKKFCRVVTIERDPVLAAIAKENFRRLGARNIEVVCSTAEEYLRSCSERFDWVYADPDRRSEYGRKLVRLEDCSPDIIELKPLLEKVAGRLCLKLSPMFDVAEAFRIFGVCRIEAVSEGGECKEVVVYTHEQQNIIAAISIGIGEVEYPYPCIYEPSMKAFTPEVYRWLVIPDTALQKARIACRHLAPHTDIWSENGYGFATERPETIIGRTFEIESIEAYDPRRLKGSLRGKAVDIFKREFPLATSAIVSQLGIKQGGQMKLAFTKVGGKLWLIRLK